MASEQIISVSAFPNYSEGSRSVSNFNFILIKSLTAQKVNMNMRLNHINYSWINLLGEFWELSSWSKRIKKALLI